MPFYIQSGFQFAGPGFFIEIDNDGNLWVTNNANQLFEFASNFLGWYSFPTPTFQKFQVVSVPGGANFTVGSQLAMGEYLVAEQTPPNQLWGFQPAGHTGMWLIQSQLSTSEQTLVMDVAESFELGRHHVTPERGGWGPGIVRINTLNYGPERSLSPTQVWAFRDASTGYTIQPPTWFF